MKARGAHQSPEPRRRSREIYGSDLAHPNRTEEALLYLYTLPRSCAFDLVRSKALMIVLLFGAVCVTFFAFGALFAAVGPNGISLRDAFIGNALAAAGMAGYLGWVLGANERDSPADDPAARRSSSYLRLGGS